MITVRRLPLAAALLAAALVAPVASAPADPIALVPHRAIYDLRLERAAARSSVEAAQGRIAFEFAGNDCDGWTMSLRQVVQIGTDGGRSSVSDTRSSSWEDGAGQAFRFATQSFINRNPQDATEGRAERSRDGGVVVQINKPADGRADLGSGVVFPTEHMRRILELARRGDSTLSIKVFDGTETGRRVYDTLAVIGRAIEPSTAAPTDAAAQRAELKAVRRWPVTISYFDSGSAEQTPLYTIAFELYESGVSRNLTLDYGDFKMRGEMTTLEFLTPTPCR